MTRRAPIRLVRLLAVACACLVPAATAHALPPDNDTPTGAQAISGLLWNSLQSPQDTVVQASDWAEAVTGPEDADPLPSCTAQQGFRSIWYKLDVPEAAVLRVTVISTIVARYQPVVTILDPSREEVGCGLANDLVPGSTANATAYVTPAADGTPATYLVRVAQVTNNSPSPPGQPMLTVRFAARDVTAPHIVVDCCFNKVQPGAGVFYDAARSTDQASGIDPATARWEFHEKIGGNDVMQPRKGMQVRYEWQSPGAHLVVFDVKDRAGNESMYKFTTLVQDTVRPTVTFRFSPPAPGAHRLRVFVKASESVRIRLLVTQAGRRKPLLRRFVTFWGDASHSRSIPLNGGVGGGVLLISGLARDLAGNATALPQCVVDPVSGQGSCTAP